LETKTYAVGVVHDGESAQQAIGTQMFDLVILDLKIHNLDGVSLPATGAALATEASGAGIDGP
jgi:DNA-binding response OmpR family regulator